MATAIASLFNDRPVKSKIAMTGEITLNGRLLPVGGIKEKILASRRAGIRNVILPSKNEKDLIEVPDIVKNGLNFIFVDNLDEVFEHALE